MFCDNCGNKITEKDTFCTKCGQKVNQNNLSIPKSNSSQVARSTPDYEEKPWYRFLKVVYIIFFVISLLGTIAIIWSQKPIRNLDTDKSLIVCDNGKSYAPSKNSIYIFGDTFNTSDDQDAKILCKYDSTNYYNYTYSNELILKNYNFQPIYIEPNYDSWLIGSLVSLIVVWLLLKIIKIAFLYIIKGVKPKIEELKKFI